MVLVGNKLFVIMRIKSIWSETSIVYYCITTECVVSRKSSHNCKVETLEEINMCYFEEEILEMKSTDL